MSGLYVPTVISWTASIEQMEVICITLKKEDVAVQTINQIVMMAVTMKMWPLHLTARVGVNVNGQDITWLASTKAAANTFTALKDLDAARWRKVIRIAIYASASNLL